MSFVGQVESLWRYPVKSMQGEEINMAAVDEQGLVGDRRYAIRDLESGHIASAKHPRRWQQLIACRARYQEQPSRKDPLPAIEITLPNGSIIWSSDPSVHDRLSTLFGRPVRLVAVGEEDAMNMREADRSPLDRLGSGEDVRSEPVGVASPAGAFFDYAPLHLISSATLAAFRDAYAEGNFDVRRFRPNVLVKCEAGHVGFVENQWIGAQLLIGAEVRVRVIDPTPRCVVTTLAQPGLDSDARVLRTIHESNSAKSFSAAPGVILPAVAGVYAQAKKHGHMRRGDSVVIGAWDGP